MGGWNSRAGPYAKGRLEDSGRQYEEKMSRKTGNSRATFIRHSAVLSLPAVLLRKVPTNEHRTTISHSEKGFSFERNW